jgi:hypothetical protein
MIPPTGDFLMTSMCPIFGVKIPVWPKSSFGQNPLDIQNRSSYTPAEQKEVFINN